jgi:hypothetical protein
LDRITSAILILCIFGYLFFTAAVMFMLPPVVPTLSTTQGQLAPTAQLAIAPGEQYVYSAVDTSGSTNLTYTISNSPSCSGPAISETTLNSTFEQCASDIGSGAQESIGTANNSILLYSPWMLSLKDNFDWVVNYTYSSDYGNYSIPVEFTSGGIVKVAGRDAYQVNVTVGTLGEQPTQIATLFVDAQKRVLLAEEAGGTSIRLVSAPFALNWANDSQ